jgi:hypothetical protein
MCTQTTIYMWVCIHATFQKLSLFMRTSARNCSCLITALQSSKMRNKGMHQILDYLFMVALVVVYIY